MDRYWETPIAPFISKLRQGRDIPVAMPTSAIISSALIDRYEVRRVAPVKHRALPS
jgi:hypothetical protein